MDVHRPFSLAQVVVSTIFVYKVDDARDASFIAIFCFYMAYMIPVHPPARHRPHLLHRQTVCHLGFLFSCWILSVCILPLNVPPPITDTLGPLPHVGAGYRVASNESRRSAPRPLRAAPSNSINNNTSSSRSRNPAHNIGARKSLHTHMRAHADMRTGTDAAASTDNTGRAAGPRPTQVHAGEYCTPPLPLPLHPLHPYLYLLRRGARPFDPPTQGPDRHVVTIRDADPEDDETGVPASAIPFLKPGPPSARSPHTSRSHSRAVDAEGAPPHA
ncbi:hypothetical protein B0H11DRAFT_2224239 [Mycena galericulata]|nr:hypothetical protein B0H11DRAFT_2224239 [Mycena galericulata]